MRLVAVRAGAALVGLRSTRSPALPSPPAPQHHIAFLEASPGDHEVLRLGLENLIAISYVDDTEVFKTCLDYWNVFVADIYTSSCQASMAATMGAGG